MRAVWLLVGVAYIATGLFCTALLYGVVVLIFRHAFGVDLPNPFA